MRWLAFTRDSDPSIDERVRAAAAGVVESGLADACDVVPENAAYFDAREHEYGGLVTWSQNFARGIARMRQTLRPVICLERGHFADRMERTRLGVGGVFGRALLWAVPDPADEIALEEGRRAGPLLVVGQPHLDQACPDIDVVERLTQLIGVARQMGYEVLYRAHPVQARIEAQQGVTRKVRGGTPDTRSLAATLAMCGTVYTLTSGVAVTAAMMGCRVIGAHENGPLYGVVPRELSSAGSYSAKRVSGRLSVLRACEFSVDQLRDGSALRKMSAEVDIARAALAR